MEFILALSIAKIHWLKDIDEKNLKMQIHSKMTS